MGRLRNRVRNYILRALLPIWLRPRSVPGLIRLGTPYGGWWVPEEAVQAGAIAYCAGAGEDISLDLELCERGCRVTTFDPTPRAIAHVEAHAPAHGHFRFVPVGWWGEEAELRFYAPSDPAWVSHSVVNLHGTRDFFVAAVRPVHLLMKDLGDDHVDLIKMDIEGAEYAVIDSLLEQGPLPGVLCLEFDQPEPVRKTIRAVRKLQRAGYRLVRIESWNYTFVMAAGQVPMALT